MKKLILITIFSAAFGQTNAQTKYSTLDSSFVDFHRNIYHANRMCNKDSFLQAYAKYSFAFENYKGIVNPSHYYKTALCALKIKEEFRALYYLQKAVIGGFEIDSLRKKEISFYNKNTKKEYQDNLPKWQKSSKEKRNAIWQSELNEYNDEYKKSLTSAYKSAFEYCTSCLKNPKCSKTAPEYASKYKLIKERLKADSTAATHLLSRIKEFGFPNLTILDKNAFDIARNILLNFDADKKNEYLNDTLIKALKYGYISPEFYASIIDRRNLINGLAPIFYEPISGYEKTIGKELNVANQKRKLIGLYPIVIQTKNKTDSKDPKAKVQKPIGEATYDY